MNLYTRLGMYFFIVGALLILLDSAFPVVPEMRDMVYVVLIFAGIFAGLLNVTEDEEHHFLMSGVAMLIVLIAFHQIFAGVAVLQFFSRFLQNAVAFVGSMAMIIAIKTVLEFGSANYRVSPVQHMEERTRDIEEWEMSTLIRTWHFVVFFAVALTFLLILVEVFFDPVGMLGAIVRILDYLVIAIFIIDLFVLYREEGSLSRFLHNCWLDIIAAIPLPGILQAVKAVRLVRIAKVTKSLKFFSHKTGKNVYIRKTHRRRDRLHVPEHPHTHQKTSSKSR